MSAYEKYCDDGKIESFQYILESSLNALEGIERNKTSDIREVMNDIEYSRFMFSKEEQPKEVEKAIAKLKEILELEK